MPGNWKIYIPAGVFFLLSFFLLFYALALAPENKVDKEDRAEVEKMFLGIEQNGSVLGDPDAPETLVEFADLQCSFCAQFAKEGLPVLLREVRQGKLKIDLRLLTILGPDSQTAAKAAQAVAPQNKMWQFVELFYLNQGDVGSGYVDDQLIGSIYVSLGVDEKLAEENEEEAAKRVQDDDELAFKAGVRGTPAFLFINKDGDSKPLSFKSFSREDILDALQKARNS